SPGERWICAEHRPIAARKPCGHGIAEAAQEQAEQQARAKNWRAKPDRFGKTHSYANVSSGVHSGKRNNTYTYYLDERVRPAFTILENAEPRPGARARSGFGRKSRPAVTACPAWRRAGPLPNRRRPAPAATSPNCPW